MQIRSVQLTYEAKCQCGNVDDLMYMIVGHNKIMCADCLAVIIDGMHIMPEKLFNHYLDRTYEFNPN